jgi:hypothetical protein
LRKTAAPESLPSFPIPETGIPDTGSATLAIVSHRLA